MDPGRAAVSVAGRPEPSPPGAPDAETVRSGGKAVANSPVAVVGAGAVDDGSVAAAVCSVGARPGRVGSAGTAVAADGVAPPPPRGAPGADAALSGAKAVAGLPVAVEGAGAVDDGSVAAAVCSIGARPGRVGSARTVVAIDGAAVPSPRGAPGAEVALSGANAVATPWPVVAGVEAAGAGSGTPAVPLAVVRPAGSAEATAWRRAGLGFTTPMSSPKLRKRLEN